ncbi:hypothetical protein [Jiella sonneratiae]|uniref:Uncharacterized protein n=1 Tax=Jiella sonneratiae TaxID=2816856 RepID=A0ABS3IZ84_9HYPH|nr:hypothetical protein [Jiella sonneratiae]MBO0902730.1 hypothetical protein [Jiella sonneratiae]
MSELLVGSYGARLFAEAQLPAIRISEGELLGLAAILAALTIAFAVSIAGILSLAKTSERLAEPFAAATFSALFGFYAALALSGSAAIALFGTGPLATLFIALGFAALLFDHVVADRSDAEGDAVFEAVMSQIEEAKRAAVADRRRHEGKDGDQDRG